MGKIAVIGATGTIGKAAVTALAARHEVIQVGANRGDYQVDAKDPRSVQALFQAIGKVDGIVAAMGGVHFGPLAQMTPENFQLGLNDKLMGQVNLVLLGQAWLNDGGSFTLTSGITAHEPIRTGSNATAVKMALEGFVRAAALELQRGQRLNLVSPTLLEESVPAYGPYFPGFEPVSSARVGLAYLRSVDGIDNGHVFRVGY